MKSTIHRPRSPEFQSEWKYLLHIEGKARELSRRIDSGTGKGAAARRALNRLLRSVRGLMGFLHRADRHCSDCESDREALGTRAGSLYQAMCRLAERLK